MKVRSCNSPTQILKLLPFSLTGKAKASLTSLTSSPSFALPSLSPGVLEYTIQAPTQSLCSLLSLECMCAMRLPSCFSRVRLFTTPWTVACQAPLSMGVSRQEHWSGLPCPPPEDLPDPGTEPTSFMSPALTGGFFTTNATWEAQFSE